MKSIASAPLRDTLANSCENCGTGFVCYEGTVTPIVCPAEYSCLSDKTPFLSLNLKCSLGKAGLNGCADCGIGHFCPYGVYLPYKCHPGTYTDNTLAIRKEDCELCPAGYACPFYGMAYEDI